MPTGPFDLAARFAAPPGPAGSRKSAVSEPFAPLADEGGYVCDACGEEIVVPIDAAAGSVQEYVEDCPVCCRPNVVTVRLDGSGAASCSARPE